MDFSRMLGYTEALSKNNERTWFHDNHREYELAQEDFLMVPSQELIENTDELAEEIAANIDA